jgi:hypothetical protein
MSSRSSNLEKYPRVLDWLRYFCGELIAGERTDGARRQLEHQRQQAQEVQGK